MIYDNNIWNIDTLVLSSGGVNGVMFLGSAVILKELNILEGIKHFIGCSAGAIVAGLLACEVDPKEKEPPKRLPRVRVIRAAPTATVPRLKPHQMFCC